MAYFSEELVMEVLLRLPVMCLLKCLLVCKDWYRLIKSPEFVNSHFNHPSSKTRKHFMVSRVKDCMKVVLSYHSLDEGNGELLPLTIRPKVPSPIRNSPFGLTLSGPCNGIFLVGFRDWSKNPVYLCNIATRKFRRIPDRPKVKPPPHPSKEYIYSGTSAFGLGIDPVTNGYKIVAAWMYILHPSHENPECIYRIGIYDLNSNSWRETEASLPAAMRRDANYEDYMRWIGGGFHFNGHLHWWIDGLPTILCFDISNEVIGQIALPPNIAFENMSIDYRTLVVLEDCLAVAVVETPGIQDVETCSIFIWMMKEYGANESWVKRFSISIPFQGFKMKPISCWNDKILLLLDVRNKDLISVNLVEEDGVKTHGKMQDGTGGIILLKESLVPLR